MSDTISDGGGISPADLAWAEARIERLGGMMASLDRDLVGHRFPGEWQAFWESMRHLYGRTAIHLSTGVRTADPRALNVGRALWSEIEHAIARAGRRLGMSNS